MSSDASNWHQARAILDTGSESNLITLSCAERIGLQISVMHSQIAGVGGNTDTRVLGCTCSLVSQKYGRPNLLIPMFVVNRVTLDLPSSQLPRNQWTHFEGLDLADPQYDSPHPVDVIFSGDVLHSILLHETRPSIRGSPVAISSAFGWLLSGGYSFMSKSQVKFKESVHVKEFSSSEQSSGNCFEMRAPRPERKNWHGLRKPIVRSTNDSSKTHSSFLSFQTEIKPSVLTLAPASLHIDKCSTKPPEYAELLDRMFKIESVEEYSPLTADEVKAEELFRKTISRLPDGRFQVALPFKTDPSCLGNSKSIALKRMKSLEHSLSRDPQKRNAYNKFMREYLELNHMEIAPPLQTGEPHYYLPHHAVHRSNDPPEKIRVVFNASQQTLSKQSLNDLLLPGPKLQLDICEVLTRFRQDRFIFIADVKQMFRQILHPPSDRNFLRILWRFSQEEPLKEYRLCTVTYGTAAAPFLAGRVLKELAEVHSQTHPQAADILNSRTYVDDLNGGSDNLQDALKIRKELQHVLSTAKLELRKWAANDERLLADIPGDHLLPMMTSVQLEDHSDSSLKILGLSWQPSSDTFHYVLRPVEKIQTKRQLASQIARVYDPLGWLIPLTVFARCIFRTVVQNHHEWDDVLPPSVTSDWSRLASQLPELSSFQIPRYIPVAFEVQWIVGFCDSSERAYAAAVYLVSRSSYSASVSLITAKARMAPIKAMTLPRLELCGAQLLARTITKILPSLRNVCMDRVLAFSDSEIALSWITAEQAPLWKVFVGNRVANIQEHVSPGHWFHVSSKDNPADHASRGLCPRDLMECKQWWNGPEWLHSPLDQWPVRAIRPSLADPVVLSEARTSRITALAASSLTHGMSTLEDRFSSLTKLQNVVAYCLRFIQRLRQRRTSSQRDNLVSHLQIVRDSMNSPDHDFSELDNPLTTTELTHAMTILVRRAQAQGLSLEIADVQTERPRLKISRSLGLFIDTDGVLRVGGRLRNAQLPDSEKHPSLLPSQHPLTRLVIEKSHRSLMHAGPLSTLHHIRSNFWIVNGKNVVRRQLAQCVDCFTVRPRSFQPEMGQLPSDRTHISSPFSTSGVDYAGPFPVSIAGLRNNRILNCYLSIFVCFSTKAVHIEVVTDLSTPGFLQAYHRFISRRGHPHTVWSDNGRNFLGAANELRRIRSLLQDPAHQNAIARETSSQGTVWKFIPPSAPFFGGLWEAAVKQAKRLLKNCLRDQVPTLESFITIATQVEGILNSRPLTAMSSSPDDLSVLTPAHFLIFRPLTMPAPDPGLESHSFKDRHRFTQYVVQNFWHRWKKEYLLELQSRSKWESKDRPALVGDLVLIIDINSPPLSWTMGKIISIYPGTDGVTRVADVRTPTGMLSRPVRKLCPFPDEVCGAAASTGGEDVESSQLQVPTSHSSPTYAAPRKL